MQAYRNRRRRVKVFILVSAAWYVTLQNINNPFMLPIWKSLGVNFDCSEAPKSNDTVTENILDNLCSPSLENQQRKDEKADTPPPYVLSN